MSDNYDYTERAKAWVRLESPNAAQLQSAYKKMLARISKQEDIDLEDAEACLEFLTECYEKGGGDMDELFATGEAESKSSSDNWDTGSLTGSDEVVIQTLTKEEKLASFSSLKASLGKKL